MSSSFSQSSSSSSPSSSSPSSGLPPVRFSLDGLYRGAVATLPLAVGLSVFGLAFGLASGIKGLSASEVGLMCLLVYAGAAQMLAVEMWTDPVPIATLALACLVINLRYLMMTPALSPWLGPQGRWRAYGTLFFVADENWAVSVIELRKGGRDAAFVLGGGLVIYSAWFVSSMVGRLTGAALAHPEAWGVDFVAPAAFLTLLASMWSGKRDILPWIVAGAVALAVYETVPGTWYLAAGGLAGSLAGACRDVFFSKIEVPSKEARS